MQSRRSIVVTLGRVDGLLDLIHREIPREVESTGNFEDWAVMAPALIAVGADLFEAIMALPPPRGRLRAEILARSLAEYAITFAWLSAPARDEERGKRRKRLVKAEFLEREKAENKLKHQLGGQSAYEHLFRGDRLGAVPRELMADVTRERLNQLKGESGLSPLPNSFDMAFDADKRWMPEVDVIGHNPFAMIYFVLFTGPSFMTHPSVSSIARMVTGSPPRLIVGVPERLSDSEMPYGQALLTLANMLFVASRSLGWPDENELRAVLDNG